jgi:hypothetical protein
MKSLLIITDAEYQQVSKRIEELKKAPAGSHGEKELKLLTKALCQYQRRHFPGSGCGISQVRY